MTDGRNSMNRLKAAGYQQALINAFQPENLNSETTSGKAGTEVTVVRKSVELHDKVIGII